LAVFAFGSKTVV